MSKRGSTEERHLVKYLEQHGFAATRIPASGGATKSDRPDVLAGNGKHSYGVFQSISRCVICMIILVCVI